MKSPAELAEEFLAVHEWSPYDTMKAALVAIVETRDAEWRATVDEARNGKELALQYRDDAEAERDKARAECDRLRGELRERVAQVANLAVEACEALDRVRELEAALRRCWKLYNGKSTTDTQALERIATVVREALGATPAQPDTTEKP